MSRVSMKQLLEAGAHFGHRTRFWNPKMAPYILCAKYGYHIFDLVKTSKLLRLEGNVLEKKSEKGASEKPETIEKNSPKKGDKDKQKKVENKSDKKSDSSKVKTTKKETVQSKKNTPQKDIAPAQIKKDATQIDSTKQ